MTRQHHQCSPLVLAQQEQAFTEDVDINTSNNEDNLGIIVDQC